ncbi:hypothetical protein PR048_012203 [Dryococelus australis]|uniref:Uncharacterized protein n=1 Tax=Dryococelus australis TaxID=614101 RepID=A0ABQ9HP29_9NEOP|nr:hypothetical protein PR048_012203 [Dryococelus australis]
MCLNKDEVFGVLDIRVKNISTNKINKDVVAHIQSFPCYQIHYVRKDNKKYYYHVFVTEFNLHSNVPSKDTCHLCDELRMKLEVVNDEGKKRN